LQEYAGVARRKRSEGKATWPGRKQVWREYTAEGSARRDVLTIENDQQPGKPLLQPAMRSGRRVANLPSLADSRAFAAEELRRLPAPLQRLDSGLYVYPVEVAAALRALADECDRRIEATEQPPTPAAKARGGLA
jgi:nicotinate phosphoribosyltransferase